MLLNTDGMFKYIDETTIYIIIASILLFIFLYVFYNTYSRQSNVIEGLAGGADSAPKKYEGLSDKIEEKIRDIDYTIKIDKQKSSLENAFLSMEKYIDNRLILDTALCATLISSNSEDKHIMETISNINQLHTFKTSLNEVINVLEKKK